MVWLVVVVLAVYAAWFSRQARGLAEAKRLIIVGGVVIPTLLLATLLIYGLALMPPVLARAPEGSLKILVVGEQWWWRVRYLDDIGKLAT